MTLYRRDDSRIWWMDFTMAGARIRRSTHTEDKAEARQIEATARLEAKRARAQPSRWRLRHLFGVWWEGRAMHTRTAATFKGHLAALSDGLGANTFMADLTAADVLRYIDSRRIISTTTNEQGRETARLRAPASINRELQALRAAINYAVDVHDQPAPRIRWKALMLKQPAVRVRYLTQPEYQRLLAACQDDHEMRLMINLACTTGLRRENLRQIQWEKIDLIEGRINVIAKGGKNFQVRLSGQPLDALRRHAAKAKQAGPGKPAIQTLTGPAFPAPNWRRRWETVLNAAGIKDYRWHDHRHTFASWARMAGVDIADIRDALNHSTIHMTTRYAHITKEGESTAWDAVSARLTQTTKGKEQ